MDEGPQKKRSKSKRARHWDELETKIMITKWSEENIQERLKSCTRKKCIWEEIAKFLNASGYDDRDHESCKTRIHTLVSAYRHYKDTKRNSTGTAPPKKPPCFEELDCILGDKPTTAPPHLISSTRNYNTEGIDDDDSISSFDDNVTFEQLMQQSDLPVATDDQTRRETNSSAPSEPSTSSGTFYFSKESKKKRLRSDILFDRLNYTMNSFMKSQSEADKTFLSNLFEKPSEQGQEQIIIQMREKGDPYCIELELDENRSMANLLSLIKNEYGYDDSEQLSVLKHPDILIRNDREVNRIKHGEKLEFVKVDSDGSQVS